MSAEEDEDVCGSCGAAVLEIDVRCASCGHSLSSTGAQRLVGSVVLEQYVITDILGQGGMSVVYRGKHKITDQEVALKVLPPELAAYKDLKGRFMEEGRALAQLDHPNIVHLYNFGHDGDCLVLAMQYVRGDTWERMILEEERLSWRRTTELTRDVSNALDYAHGRGIIHRDMKPSNVLVRDLDGAATVMDFGIAKMQTSTKLTVEGQTMGTVRYMSPEQVRGVEVGVETDIYSLAMTAYESLVGDTPFSGDTHFEIMTKHLNEAPVPPSKRGIDLPPALEAVLMRAISKVPSDRQGSALEFKEQLQAVLDGSEPQGIRTSIAKTQSMRAKHGAHAAESEASKLDDSLSIPAEGRRRRGSNGLIALGALVLAAGAGTFIMTRDSGGEAGAKGPGAGSDTGPSTKRAPKIVESTAGAFLMPGLDFVSDETYEAEQLRIMTTGEIPAAKIRDQVLAAREKILAIAKEEDWPEGTISLPLAVAVVPQVVICNPDLYESGKVQAACMRQSGYYRPYQRTLYIVAESLDTDSELPYWISYVRCLHSKAAPTCSEVISKRFPKR